MKLMAIALLPIVVLLFVIYKIDRYNKEPKKLLTILFVGGCLITIPILLVENFLVSMVTLQGDYNNLYTAFVVASMTEEVFKWLILMVFAFHHLAFDERLDGIIYGVFVGLGFSAIENLLYVFSHGVTVGIVRALTAVPAHMLFGVSMGYYLSIWKFGPRWSIKKWGQILSLLIPILLHGVYDYILMSDYKWLLILFIPYLIYMWLFGIKRLRRYYKESRESCPLEVKEVK